MSKPSKSWIPNASPSSGTPSMNVPFDTPKNKDWNVKYPKMSPNDSQGNPTNKVNAMLISGGGKKIGLWVNEITTDFSLGGSTAQSQNKQQFFPSNFTQPKIIIRGQAPNGYEMGRLAEVIRESHQLAIDDGDAGLGDQYRAVRFMKFGKTYTPNYKGVAGSNATARTGRRNRTNKGLSSQITVDGYISGITRGAERYLVAYDWQFELVVLRSVSMLGLRDPVLDSQLIKVVKTIEDALVKADRSVPEIDPFGAYSSAAGVDYGSGEYAPTTLPGGENY